ncbi:MAG TPA: hypothetical protein VHX37_13900 [Acidobacteriaceae bacterium]|jgi:glycogen debranching enzyme|nr:hypothetical protein [Acidobacteriaceae bacterium]
MKMRIALGVAALAVCAGQARAVAQPVASRTAGSPGADQASGLRIVREVEPARPFSVVGPRGALLGHQNGGFEAWVFPWKIFGDLRISAQMQDYDVPLDVNAHASEIEVRPDSTTIVYAHANFTLRQTMMAPKTGPADEGVLVQYQIEAIRPVTLTFSFDPVMQRMWPALSDDHCSPEWVSDGHGSGYYILHLNFPDHAAGLAMPGAEAGILPPYQEGPKAWPLQLVLHFDPKRDSGKSFPLLISMANNAQAAGKAALGSRLAALENAVPATVQQNRAYYDALINSSARVESPDEHLNAAFAWAVIALDQLRVETTPGLHQEALTAGFVASGDAARPGFGWFFGRDALWSLYAVDSYGGFATARDELRFLASHQSPEGKITHEWSQTAGLVDWASLPYEWASSDATPLFLMAANDYLAVSGDAQFIRELWPSLSRAWQFETTHDSDHDGIFDNSEGSGWVESWIPKMPHQEIYLAALDQQASTAMAHLAAATQHDDVAHAAQTRAMQLGPLIEKEYYLPSQDNYAFSHNPDGTTDDTATIFPAVAWWDGSYRLEHGASMSERWASSEFSTDWGTRILSDRTWFYDPISYHQGTVWPLFTGWVSLAEYRTGHPLSGYAHLMQNVDLTWAQDLGDVTELLSGEFYQMLGRSTAHQLWSSAMVVSPILRGLFGLQWDAASQTLSVDPHLPAEWPGASLHNLPFGSGHLDLTMERHGGDLVVRCSGAPAGQRLRSHIAGARMRGGALLIPLPPVEAGLEQSLPPFGAMTRQMKVLNEQYQPQTFRLSLAAQGGSEQSLEVRVNAVRGSVSASDGDLQMRSDGTGILRVAFPPGSGYVEKDVTLRWK